MKRWILRQTAVGMAGLGLLVPAGIASAAESSRPIASSNVLETSLINDVALSAGGALTGQVVDAAGQGMANVTVELRQHDATVATTKTGDEGMFAVRNLPGGMYQVSAGEGVGMFRLWAPDTAPPAAARGAMIVNQPSIIRGQGSRIRSFLTNPLVIAGVVAVAVAVPIAVHQYNVDHRSGS